MCTDFLHLNDKVTDMNLSEQAGLRNISKKSCALNEYEFITDSYISCNGNQKVANIIWNGICVTVTTQQTKLYYRNIITILSFAVFNITSAYYGNVAQENTTFTNITLPNNII